MSSESGARDGVIVMRTTVAYLVHDCLWIGVWLWVGGWWSGIGLGGLWRRNFEHNGSV